MKKVTFLGWKNCIELENGDFRLIVTTEIGPRVIAAFYGKSENLFHVDPELAGKKGGNEWVNYGGHRLWHSPETKERTYEPDNGNEKVTVYELEEGGYEFTTPKNAVTGITKSLRIFPEEDETFRVEHIVRNDGVWTIDAAAWALSVMAPGGVAVVPQNRNDFQLLPTSFYSIWPYMKMNDPRVTWGADFLLVRQDPKAENPMKVGFNCQNGWLAYLNKGVAFLKQFAWFEGEDYPDNGCSVEVYTNKDMLEAETLSPLCTLEPGDEVRHIEMWSAFPVDGKIETEADAADIFQCDDEEDSCGDSCGCGCCHEDHADEVEEIKKPSKKAKSSEKKTSAKKEKSSSEKKTASASKKKSSGKTSKK